MLLGCKKKRRKKGKRYVSTTHAHQTKLGGGAFEPVSRDDDFGVGAPASGLRDPVGHVGCADGRAASQVPRNVSGVVDADEVDGFAGKRGAECGLEWRADDGAKGGHLGRPAREEDGHVGAGGFYLGSSNWAGGHEGAEECGESENALEREHVLGWASAS